MHGQQNVKITKIILRCTVSKTLKTSSISSLTVFQSVQTGIKAPEIFSKINLHDHSAFLDTNMKLTTVAPVL